MPAMTAYGYIRKSVVQDPTRMLSPETQETAIRALAARHGDADVTILSDLDVSGRKDRTKRPGWNELLRAVEDGDATAVYAYSLSRFARSVQQLLEFFELCESKKVPIRMDRDQIDTSNAMGEMTATILASIVQMEARIASERVRDAFATKRAKEPAWRGPGNLRYGERDGEDPSVVVEAFREVGSFDGAARLLNARQVACRVKGAVWSGSVVREIVRRHAPDEVGPSVKRGAPAGRRSFRFAQLVACGECGHFLTGSRDSRRGVVRYQCARSRVVPHGRGWVNESKLLPVVRVEAERAALMMQRVQKGSADDEAVLAALEAKRARLIDMYADGLIDKSERDRRLAAIVADESKLSGRRWVRRITRPLDIEADDAGAVNTYLRRLFARATVNMSQPASRGPSRWVPSVSFEWRDPSMRSEAEDDDAA